MVIFIVPYPCGTIFSIFLIIMGIFTLPANPEGGISMIIFGTIFLIINQAITGSGRSQGSPLDLRSSSHYNRQQLGGMRDGLTYFCPECGIEYTTTNASNLCPSCQIPLKTKPTMNSGFQNKQKSFYFDNQ